jgi:hypothetical protein
METRRRRADPSGPEGVLTIGAGPINDNALRRSAVAAAAAGGLLSLAVLFLGQPLHVSSHWSATLDRLTVSDRLLLPAADGPAAQKIAHRPPTVLDA